jgi:predicted PhzF superfamily epimerase YddE/YHI9
VRILYQVDSFTTRPFTGNPAGVVLEAQGMTDAEMLAVARELNNSETAFVLPADAADHDVRVRFFTPTTEVPTCGHATVGAHFARAVEYGQPLGTPLVQGQRDFRLQPRRGRPPTSVVHCRLRHIDNQSAPLVHHPVHRQQSSDILH